MMTKASHHLNSARKRLDQANAPLVFSREHSEGKLVKKVEGKFVQKYLVVVDVQRDFVDGSLGTEQAQAIVDNVVSKIKTFDGNILVTADIHRDETYLDTQEGKRLPVKHCINATDGAKIVPQVADEIRPATKSGQMEKVFFKSSFGSVELCEYLKGVDRVRGVGEITLIGLCTDICVISNAIMLKAFLPEARIVVDASCCAGVTPESHKTALLAMKACQIDIENGGAGL